MKTTEKWAVHLIHHASYLRCTMREDRSRTWKQHAQWLVNAVRRAHVAALISNPSGPTSLRRVRHIWKLCSYVMREMAEVGHWS